MTNQWYVLHDKTPVQSGRNEVLALLGDDAARRVAETKIGYVVVSTVFLFLDHAFRGEPPQLFETMIFGGAHGQYQERCSTWEQAEAQHAEAVRLVEKDAV
jgi:hypothetical protein